MGNLPQLLANLTHLYCIKMTLLLVVGISQTLFLIGCISLDQLQKIAKISPARSLHRDRHRQLTVVLSIALTVLLDIITVRLPPMCTHLPAFLLETGLRCQCVTVSLPFSNFVLWTGNILNAVQYVSLYFALSTCLLSTLHHAVHAHRWQSELHAHMIKVYLAIDRPCVGNMSYCNYLCSQCSRHSQ